MSFVTDHIRRVDGQLDRLQLTKQPSAPSSPELHSASDGSTASVSIVPSDLSVARVLELQVAIRELSTASSAQSLQSSATVLSSLAVAGLLPSTSSTDEEIRVASTQEQELEWLVIGKATAQTYGIILNTLLDQTIPLSSDIAYWDEVLGSYQYTSWYTIQTSPLRLWGWLNDIYRDASQRFQSIRGAGDGDEGRSPVSLSNHWRQFYSLVKDSVRDRSLADMQSIVLSPLTRSRMEARSRRNRIKRLREMSASGLGILMDEGMVFDADDEESVSSKSHVSSNDEWRSVVSKSISLMETVLQNITVLELGTSDLEDTIFQSVNDDTDPQGVMSSLTAQMAARLEKLLIEHIPAHISATRDLGQEYGRPSRLVRYWLPGVVLVLSSSTLLRIFVKRKAEIITWIRDIGTTTIDFWNNWVVEPVRKVVGTIRHDEDSEIAIMSKESLQGDKASLERMVVEFAIDNPNTTTGVSLTDLDIADIRAKVKEGDLTPVLRAYEKDLRKPFVGTIRGDLIRALLIQIQKTKVDVEVAVGGINNLLKSQELVFGFIGLTPGVMVCFGLSRWLNGLLAGRQDNVRDRKQDSMIRCLRNIDRTLTGSVPSENGVLSYKDHGMLLCEAHILRQRAKHRLPGDINNEFLEEMRDLIDLRVGVKRQMHTVERIRWAYAHWLQ